MQVLTESELRAKCLGKNVRQYYVDSEIFVTPSAKEYLKERGIELVVSTDGQTTGSVTASADASDNDNRKKYVDYLTGKEYSEKPESMTHLYGNVLVSKSHPRIVFRGKLDSLSAEIVKVQTIAKEYGFEDTVNELAEVLNFNYNLLGAEVNETPVSDIMLLGYDSDALRYATHHMTESFGFEHTLPHYKNGRLCAELNRLRTIVRETELYGVKAFEKNGKCSRNDIIEALNRLSSCVYIIYCRLLSKQS